MRTLTVFLLCILRLAAVHGDKVPGKEVEKPYRGVEVSNIRGRQANDEPPISSYVCGYQDGYEALPWRCPSDSNYCMVEPIQGVVGCCESNSCAAFRTACYGPADLCDNNCMNDCQNLICSDPSPICATYSYPSQVTELRCESTVPANASIAYTYSGFSAPIRLPRYVASYPTNSLTEGFTFGSISTGLQTPSISAAAPSSTPSISSVVSTSTTSTPTESTTTISTPTIPNPAPSPATDSSTSTGIIAGSVVAGLAVILAFAGFVIYLRYKRQPPRHGDAHAQAYAQTSSTVQEIPSLYELPHEERLYELPQEMPFSELPGGMKWS